MPTLQGVQIKDSLLYFRRCRCWMSRSTTWLSCLYKIALPTSQNNLSCKFIDCKKTKQSISAKNIPNVPNKIVCGTHESAHICTCRTHGWGDDLTHAQTNETKTLNTAFGFWRYEETPTSSCKRSVHIPLWHNPITSN